MEMPRAMAYVEQPLSLRAMQAGRELFNPWSANTKFRIGDDMAWSAVDFDDSAWPDTIDLDEDWSGVFWSRSKTEIDSTLWGVPLAVSITQMRGALEIYLDGQLLLSSGKVSPNRDEYEPYWVRTPKIFSLTPSAEHTIALRFAYFPPARFGWSQLFAKRQVLLQWDLAERAIATRYDPAVIFLSVIAGIYSSIGLLHLILFAFHRREPVNLYYGLFVLLCGGLLAHWFQQMESEEIAYAGLWQLLAWAAAVALPLLLLRFIYALFYERLPRQFWIFAVALTVTFPATFAGEKFFEWIGLDVPVILAIIWDILAIVLGLTAIGIAIEYLRVIAVALYRRKPGAWLFAVGLCSGCCSCCWRSH